MNATTWQMTTENSRKETKIQGRIDPGIKSDYEKMASKQNISLGGLVTKVLTLYWQNKKRKGEC